MAGADARPTRHMSAFMVRLVSDILWNAKQSLELDFDEIAMMLFIVHRSLEMLLTMESFAEKYGYESSTYPTEYRLPVDLKTIHNSLRLSRETTRRKLADLVERKFLERVKGGYVMPAQAGETDYTKFMRELLTSKFYEVADAHARLTRF